MALLMSTGTYLSAKEVAVELGIAPGTFKNLRSEHGDDLLTGHALIPGRVHFKAEDVERLRQKRASL